MSIFTRYENLWSFYTKLFILHFLCLTGGYLLDIVIKGSFGAYYFFIGLSWVGIGFILIISLFGRIPTRIETVHWRQELHDHYTKDYWGSRGSVIIVGATFAVFGLLMFFLSASSDKVPIFFFLAAIGLLITLGLYLYFRRTLGSH